MHRISKLVALNYRSCRSTKVDLEPYTPIVGYNNAGKSNIISALEWFIAPKSLKSGDFWNTAAPVVVQATVEGIDAGVLSGMDATHRSRIQPFLTPSGTMTLRRRCPSPGASVNQCKLEIRDPSVTSDTDPEAWKVNPTGISAGLKALFPTPILIGAMENAVEDAGKYKTSTTIGRLISEIMDSVASSQAAQFTSVLNDLKQHLDSEGSTRAPELVQFDSDASRAVTDFFPGLSVRIHIPTPEVEDLFKQGTIRVYESGNRRELDTMGHGAQRSIQMALIRVLAERQQAAGTSGKQTLLLIDEPELYLHPQGIERIGEALEVLSRTGYQVVFSTHSPVLVRQEHVASAVLVRKEAATGTAIRPSVKSVVATAIADAPSQSAMLMSLGHASQWLFAERVVLVEGRTEKRLLPELFRACQGSKFRSAQAALLGQGGVDGMMKTASVLDALGVPWKAVVDLDFAFRGAVTRGMLPATDPDLQACSAEFPRLAAAHGFALDTQGLPMKNAQYSADAAFALVAADPVVAPKVISLHEKLLAQSVWLWWKGAIEHHLGIQGKKEKVWTKFLVDMKNDGVVATVHDLQGVGRFTAWVATP